MNEQLIAAGFQFDSSRKCWIHAAYPGEEFTAALAQFASQYWRCSR